MIQYSMTPIRDYKVNRLLWESLEATLLAHGKRFVKDMAGTLQVNEKELLKRVFPSKEAFRVSIQDAEVACCMAFVPGPVMSRCRRPVTTGTAFCAAHALERPTCTIAPTVRRLQARADLTTLWLLDTDVLDSDGQIRGRMNEQTNQLFLITDP
jgi:hypothetical protein